MKPPYQLTSSSVKLIAEVSRKIGEINSSFLIKQTPELRKRNKIKTIHSSLAIEGNTLSIDQITAIIENKKVLGPSKDIKEVSNAILVYDQLLKFNPCKEKDFLKAHKMLMQGLIGKPGNYRKGGVGIVKGRKLTHLAPPDHQLPRLMKELFDYLKDEEDLFLIKSCVFHYEVEFIHPFSDGNGRMGRLWQTVLLMKEFPIFEYLPFETIISKKQKAYYQALSNSDKKGSSTLFIEFMLETINETLDEMLTERTGPISNADRIQLYVSTGIKEFSRRDYMAFFKSISSATASRDLNLAVKENIFKKMGDKNKTVYSIN